ncbi:MAG: choice-of-anchor J domain-containing protein [Bacteroidetes bacterium]|nr:choice-of-anchor J domain-containing protein [Bacteroidota bacterium]
MVHFPAVWKGIYRLTAVKFGYDTIVRSIPVAAPVLLNYTLMQVKIPPANLTVNDRSLLARWDVPHQEKQIFMENWTSGSFNTNSWSFDGSANWSISPTLGNPSPSAMFTSEPWQSNYSQSLISRTIFGQHSTLLKLKYDLSLNNVSSGTINQMTVEIWDGVAWQMLKNYSNTGGNIPWTTQNLDISGYSNLDFKIRFHASGENSADIDHWNIDNIEVIASEPAQEQANCILGYYFYLGNVISGYTTQNAYSIPGNQVQYGQTYDACVRALYGSSYSDFSCTPFTSFFLYPVLNLQGYSVENKAHITWEKPVVSRNGLSDTPPGLIGYSIFRNDSIIAVLDHPDSLSFADSGLEPEYYRYGVSARYDLTAYGFPGEFDESFPAGPLQIVINWGLQIPFNESWNEGSFTSNDWRFTPSQGNWTIDQNEGNPPPAANFKWQPPLIDYNNSLESPPVNGLPFNCSAIWLDFDLKLDDRNFTGTEEMNVEVFYNNSWHKKAGIKNTGSFSWTNYHTDISPAHGKGFRVRFRASGQNSSEILNWYVDNVRIYSACYPAANLEGEAMGNNVMLTWSPPACYGGNLLYEGFEESYFPPEQWTQQISNPAATWYHASETSTMGVHNGNFSAGLNWDYNHQDEWLIANDIFVNGDLTFWSYAFQGSLHHDHYYIKVSTDHGTTWNVLMDMSALPAYPGSTGINDWITPYHLDLSLYDGETIDIAWHAVDGDGNGLWYPWAIDDCSIGTKNISQTIIGYDVYRKGYGAPGFEKINPGIVTDTSWLDVELPMNQYQYYVKALFDACENTSNSDTISVDVITGISARHFSSVYVVPNPVRDYFTVTGSTKLGKIELYDATGRIAGTWIPEDMFKMTVGTRGLRPGFYLLRVRTGAEVNSFKICLLNNTDE